MEHNLLHAHIIRCIQKTSTSNLTDALKEWDFHEVACALSSSKNCALLFKKLPSELQSEIIFLLSTTEIREVITHMSEPEIGALAYFLDETEIERLKQIVPTKGIIKSQLERIQEQKEDIKEFLQFAPETAGSIMHDSSVLVKENFALSDVADRVDSYLKTHDTVPVIIVTDTKEHVVGRLHFARLIVSDPKSEIRDIVSAVAIASSNMDQEDLVALISQHRRDDIVVAVDENNRPMGVIHATDLLKVMEQEATEDLYQFAGVSHEEKAVEPIRSAVKYRYKWLLVNLATAFLAAWVVTLFEDTLSRLVVLAAYMPIVAGMGGNSGTQTLAVIIRGIATGEIEKNQGIKVAVKEVGAGIINGLIVGVVVSGVAILWQEDPMLGLVLVIAMVVNMLAAGLFGTIIPLTLRRLHMDPAVSSAVFLTTVTDVLGFFVFLGLASLLL